MTNSTSVGPPFYEPVLTLDPPKKEYSRDEVATFELYTDPADNTSPKYKVSIPYFDGSGSLHDCIQSRINIKRIWTGLALGTGTAKNAIAVQLLKGVARDSYETGRNNHRDVRHELAKVAARDAVDRTAYVDDAAFQTARTAAYK